MEQVRINYYIFVISIFFICDLKSAFAEVDSAITMRPRHFQTTEYKDTQFIFLRHDGKFKLYKPGKAAFPLICDKNNHKAGLELMLNYFYIDVCDNNIISTNDRLDYLKKLNIHLVIFVDDEKGLSKGIIEEFKATNRSKLIRKYKGKSIIKLSVLRGGKNTFTDATQLNVLYVGEMDYRRIKGKNKNDKWWKKLNMAVGYDLTNQECGVTEHIESVVESYSDAYLTKANLEKSALLEALASFTRTMQFDSSYDAKPHMTGNFNKLLEKRAVKFVKSSVKKYIPGAEELIGIYESIDKEMKRAEKSGRSYKMVSWINDMSIKITDCMLTVNCKPDANDKIEIITKKNMSKNIIAGICKLPSNRRDAAIKKIIQLEKQDYNKRDSLLLMEKGLLEAWINSHWTRDSDRGAIEIVWNYDEDEGKLDAGSYKSAKILIKDYGDNAEDALNSILRNSNSTKRIFDFKVKKNLCFIVQNSVYGRTKRCSTFDENNKLIRRLRTVDPLGISDKLFKDRDWDSDKVNKFR